MKNKIIIVSLIFVIAALLLNSFYNFFSLSREEKIAKEIANPKNDIIRYEYVTHDSTIVKYVPNVGELMQNNVTKQYNTYVTDTLAPAFKIAQKDITELQQIRAKLEGTIKAQKAEIDKEKTRSVFYKDKYFSAVTKTDSIGNSSLDYQYNAQIDIITAKKKKNLFAKEIQEITISSPDKNLQINGVEHFKKNLTVAPKKWGLGVQAGYYYVPSSNTFYPAVGLGLSYNPIRF